MNIENGKAKCYKSRITINIENGKAKCYKSCITMIIENVKAKCYKSTEMTKSLNVWLSDNAIY